MDDLTMERWQDPGKPGTQGMKLSGSMTIGQAAGLKEALLTALGEGRELRLDLAGVTEIDLAGLQLLAAAQRSALTQGKGFSVEPGGNQAFLETAAIAGMQREAGCDLDTKGNCIWAGGES